MAGEIQTSMIVDFRSREANPGGIPRAVGVMRGPPSIQNLDLWWTMNEASYPQSDISCRPHSIRQPFLVRTFRSFVKSFRSPSVRSGRDPWVRCRRLVIVISMNLLWVQ